MRYLSIETASTLLGAAVADETRLLAAASLHVPDHPHAAELPGMVKRLMESTRTGWKDLAAVVVDIGPGSFTGLRIGVAFAKALAAAKRIPVIGVPSLDVLAAKAVFAGQPVCPVMDAKRKNVYGAVYRAEGAVLKKITDYHLSTPEDFVARVKEPAVFLGDACALYGERLLKERPGSVILPEDLWWPDPATLARLGRERFASGKRDDAATLTPMYLYPLDCSVRGSASTAAQA